MQFSESDIQQWFNSTYAQRGERYQQQGCVSDLRQVDDELRAKCDGSRPQPYSVRVTVQEETFADSRCSCPIGGGCKHVIAVLYEFVRSSGDVPEKSALEQRVSDLGRDRLAELLVTYAERHPDFESWIEAQLAAEMGEMGSVDRAEMRRRVEQTVSREANSQSYRNPASFEDLEDLRRTARTYIDAGAAQNAANILAPIARCLVERYHMFDDSHGGVTNNIDRTASGLIDAFQVAEEPSVRSTILRDLWELWLWNSEYGGVLHGTSFHRAFSDSAAEWEQQTLVDWARQALNEKGPRSEENKYTSDWHRQRLGRLVIDLEGDALSEDEMLDIVDQAALETWWIRKLLERGEFDRAGNSTADLSASEQLRLVDDFLEHGYDDIAEEILLRVEDEGGSRKASRAREKLVEFYDERERWDDALPRALENFEERPNRKRLREVEHLARRLDRWETLETDLLNTLTEKAPAELVWYYIEDDDPEAAVAIWRSTDISRLHLDSTKFAEAIAETHPDIALELFNRAAESLIRQRGRSNYHEACQYIGEMRDIYESFERVDEWQRDRDEFLEEFNNLPAFKDEMRKAKLNGE